jgi:hypothetical protein
LEEEMVRVNRRSLARLEARLERLHEAVRAASCAGDALAQVCTEGSVDGMLAKMTSYFEGRVSAGQAERKEQTSAKTRDES